MNMPESNIIRLDGPLDPEHGGIVAWHFGGNRSRIRELFGNGEVPELYSWATDLTRMTTELAFTLSEVPPGREPNNLYNEQFGEATQRPGRVRWRAVVAPGDASNAELTALQQNTHDQWQFVIERMQRRLELAQRAGNLAVGIEALDDALHALPHLHTVDLVIENAGQPIAPVEGLWVPRLNGHGGIL